MASSFEKSVKGATKPKAAPPKSKYIEHILVATHSGENGVAEIFRALQNRLRDSSWTIVFKSLITVHLMIREGSPDVTLSFLAKHKNILYSTFTDVHTQGRNIRHYTSYLNERARAYRDTKCDHVRGAERRLEKLTVDKGLLRETEAVQHQITALLKCDVLDNGPDNEITITVFRMLVLDLLTLFNVINQAMINILGHFFEMSKPDAERAMEIYRNFVKQTDFVVGYLGVARQYEHQTRVEVPKLKHAPVHLGKQLEDYLSDPDFETNRRQYLAEQESKGRGGQGSSNGASRPFGASSKSNLATANSIARGAPAAKVTQPSKGADLIDLFGSIEQPPHPIQNQQGMQMPQYTGAPFQVQQQQPQFSTNGFLQQQTGYQDPNQFQQQHFGNGFANGQQQQLQQPQQLQQVQTNFTGAGFGGYTPQTNFQPGGPTPSSQDPATMFQHNQQQMGQLQAQQTNPFRLTTAQTGALSYPMSPPIMSPMTQQSTNPFAKSASFQSNAYTPPPDQQFQSQPPSIAPLRPTATGTNPFARNLSNSSQHRPQTAGGIMAQPTGLMPQQTGLLPQPTGSTNPFRQSQFVNTATGMGWQNNQQPIGGGLDHIPTVPVFPRPAQQQPWQQ